MIFRKEHQNPKQNLTIEHLPVVLEQLQLASIETRESYKKEFFDLMNEGQFPGDTAHTSLLTNIESLYFPLSSGEMVYYTVTPPLSPSNPDPYYTKYIVHFIFPKDLVDVWEKKIGSENTKQEVKSFLKPIRQFITANRATFFLAGIISAIIELLNK
ncbi:hypothetical protein ACQFX9_14315 [Aliinostoc sp. HNIBRCY26]|uniref:hypothetical protein n=1 Tax=Aliinostoc sp. HNIBRCY26 TaxID=3418997 RepID=UPI003D04A7EB